MTLGNQQINLNLPPLYESKISVAGNGFNAEELDNYCTLLGKGGCMICFHNHNTIFL